MFYREAQQNIQSFLMALRRKLHCPERIHHDSWGSLGRSRSRSLPAAVGVFKGIPPHSSAFPGPGIPKACLDTQLQEWAGGGSVGARGPWTAGARNHYWNLLLICFKWLALMAGKVPSPGVWKGATVGHQGKGSSSQSPVSEISFSSVIFPVSLLQWLCFGQGL